MSRRTADEQRHTAGLVRGRWAAAGGAVRLMKLRCRSSDLAALDGLRGILHSGSRLRWRQALRRDG